MLAIAIAAALVAQTPGESHARAFLDLSQSVPAESRRQTRYLSLAAVPPADRDAFVASLTFTLNSTSFESTFYTPTRVGADLVRLDLTALGWDRGSRARRIARLKGEGVDVSSFKEDLWEEFAKADPYFFTTTYNSAGTVVRGWLDPAADEALRLGTYASKAVLRADWLLPKLWLEAKDGGFYSQALLHPPLLADLFKVYGVPKKLVDADPQLKSGGAVLESIVALHNRGLRLLPSLYPPGAGYIWETDDFAADATGDKSVLDSLADTAKRDGGEMIGTLPNGLHWYYLVDSAGKQVNVVPQNIAIDKRSGAFDSIRDRSVINAYKCLSCHGPLGGIYPFDDVVAKAILAPDIGLAVLAKDKQQEVEKRRAVELYYLSGLAGKMSRQQEEYAARVKACNGQESGPNSVAVVTLVEAYIYDLVTPEAAAREMGRDLEAARILWRNSGNSQLVVLSSGQAINRGAWERAWADAMRADVYPWDEVKGGY